MDISGCGEDRGLVNLEGDSSWKHLLWPWGWALDPCASIAPRGSCFQEGVGYCAGGQVWLGQAAASSISTGILLGSIFFCLGVGHWTHGRRLRRPSRAFWKALVTFETWTGGACAASDKVVGSRQGRRARPLFLALPDCSVSCLDVSVCPSLKRWLLRVMFLCFSDSAVVASARPLNLATPALPARLPSSPLVEINSRRCPDINQDQRRVVQCTQGR